MKKRKSKPKLPPPKKGNLIRLKVSKNYMPDYIDGAMGHNGTYLVPPTVGGSFAFWYDRLDLGAWITTPVTKVLKRGKNTVFETRNSTYVLYKGWIGDE